ncbi:CCN family member 1-like [Clupea harengus]|uniref:CCN family member 1-like n=1 Tax=Clupea harengus TaxID=7950 RepID=A0A6P3VYW7_CLUHA|nr:CCN family member 1-like [Clupea harengus]
MNSLIPLAFLTMASIYMVGASCPAVCRCPSVTPACPPGVSAVPDGCGCCRVCAAQLNQDCSAARPCDHHKGLECNYGNDAASTWGVCRAKLEGRSCEFGGRMYQNGEGFRVGCKHQCTCVDGAVGCAPLCTNQLPLASPDCPYPSLVRVPGQCCFSVECHKGALPPLLPPKQKQKPRPKQHQNQIHHDDHSQTQYRVDDNRVSNNVADRVVNWADEQGYKHLPVWSPAQRCVVQTTDWSACSSSCGMGVSSRITNGNAQCKLQKETRLCNIRPCSSLDIPPKKGKKCSRTRKSPEPVRFSYAGCRSVRLYRPNYCGVCVDGRCCQPTRARTVLVPFQCQGGERVERAVMFVQSCRCSDDCGHLNEAALPPKRWMYGDTHKFLD